MKLNTCSAVISFLTKLEEDTRKFYETLAHKLTEHEQTFLSFSKENRKFKVMVERAYYGVITDALEACFSFKEGLESDKYQVPTEIDENIQFPDALNIALNIEKKIMDAYNEAATLSESLMADVPRTFKIIVKKRNERINKLQDLK